MIPTHRELHPRIHEALGTGRYEGRRGHRHAGSMTSALSPYQAGMFRFKGGGGFKSIVVGVVVGAVLGAMTGGIGFAALGIGGASAITVGGVTIAAAGIEAAIVGGAILGGISGVLSGALGMVMGGQKPDEVSAASYQARDNKITARNSVGPRKKIYGTALAGGLMVYATSTGSTHEYFHSVNAIATHQVQAIRESFFNNVPSSDKRFGGASVSAPQWVSGTDYAAGTVVTYNGLNYTRTSAAGAPFTKSLPPSTAGWLWTQSGGFFRLSKHLGTQTQTADSDLVAESGGEWTTAHRLRETAYIYPRIKYDTNAWVSGLPSTTVMVDGAIYYDPRSPHLTLSTSATGSPGVFTTVGAHGFEPGDIIFIRDHAGATYAAPNGLNKAVSKRYTVNTVPTTSTFTLLNDSGEPMPLLTGGAGGSVAKCMWSNNATLAILDYITSRDGINCKTSEVDWSYWSDAADVCDEDVPLGTSATFTASATSNALTLGEGVGWQTGKQVFVASSGTLPAPLVAGTAYYWIRSDETTGQLATSYDNAIAGTAIDLTSAGSGAHTITVSTAVTLSATANTVTLPNLSTYIETGDCVTLTGALAGTDYYWINTDYLTGKLATSRANAMAGVTVDIAADESVRITRKSQARYTVNGIIDLSKKPIDILNELLTACGGVMVYTQGKYRLFPAAPAASVKTISESDLRGSIKILPHTSRMTLVNAVRGTYKEPAKYWEMTDFPPLTNATYEAEDGGQRLYRDIALPHTIDPQRAQRIASIALGRSRRGMVVNFPATVKMLGISAWDCIQLDLSVGASSIFSGKKFRVVSWVLAENGQGIDLTLNEEDDAVYEWSAGHGAVVPQNDLSNLPDPWNVAEPTGLTLSSGTAELMVLGDGTVASRIKASWTDPADASVRRIEVQAKPSASASWQQFAPALPGVGYAYISPVTDGDQWDLRVRAVNTLGAMSDWVTVTGHTVTGKTAPPSAVTGFSASQNGTVVVFRWSPVPDVDIAGYDIRYGVQGSAWETKTPLTTTTRGTQITTAAVLPGDWEFAIKAVDTSGNSSTSATLAAIIIKNVNDIVFSAEQSPAWISIVGDTTEDLGLVSDPATAFIDCGRITEPVTEIYDLGGI